ncbi:MAG: LytTR family DNA-binding domain-containing protein [Bacteroidales bacterium]|nr:LytTR family DNA-binding domain-containing protein [Bacteroidales bacterium]
MNNGIWVKDKNRIRMLNYNDITHICYRQGISEIRNGHDVLKHVHMPLCRLEKSLPLSMFFRTHRNFIINRAYIEVFDKACQHVRLRNGATVPVSRRKRKLFQLFVDQKINN